jgi:HrpA-like RNA helicase
LPIEEHREDILKVIGESKVSFICGKTGCGKSSRVPKFLLDQGKHVKVLMTLPRRVTVTGLAKYVAKLMKVECGGLVGYRMSKEVHSNNETRLLFVTVGYALHYFANHFAELNTFTHIILDEVSTCWSLCVQINHHDRDRVYIS